MHKKDKYGLNFIHDATYITLKKFIEICETERFEYCIAYGTLLGAVRHQDFIPWDDDCDVMMPRDSFTKLTKYCEYHKDDLYPFKLFSKDNTKRYPYAISRFSDTSYQLIDESYDYGIGTFIDIYPFDNIGIKPQSKLKRIKLQRRILQELAYLSTLDHYKKSSRGGLMEIIHYPAYLYSRKKGTKIYLDKLDTLHKQFRSEKEGMYTCLNWYTSADLTCYKKSDLFETILLKIRALDVRAPKDYDRILTILYGDYMEYPPEEKRNAYHSYKLIKRDTENESTNS